MRELTKQQKRLLAAYQDKVHFITDVDDMDDEVWFMIDNLHPCEINWQSANRFLRDRAMAEAHGERSEELCLM